MYNSSIYNFICIFCLIKGHQCVQSMYVCYIHIPTVGPRYTAVLCSSRKAAVLRDRRYPRYRTLVVFWRPVSQKKRRYCATRGIATGGIAEPHCTRIQYTLPHSTMLYIYHVCKSEKRVGATMYIYLYTSSSRYTAHPIDYTAVVYALTVHVHVLSFLDSNHSASRLPYMATDNLYSCCAVTKRLKRAYA
jgi:hypothetical protein